MAKIIVRGKKKDLRIPKGQFALVSKDKTATRAKIKREGKLEDPNVVVEDYMISKNAIVRTIKELFALHENDGVEHE